MAFIVVFFFFFFNDTATTEIYTLSLHDALPIYKSRAMRPQVIVRRPRAALPTDRGVHEQHQTDDAGGRIVAVLLEVDLRVDRKSTRLNSSHSQISYAVFCLKKKNKNHISEYNYT